MLPVDIAIELSCDPKTSGETLSQLANYEYFFTRYCVATHPNTPKKVLCYLMKDKNLFVRSGVAMNVTTSAEMLAVLIKDEEWEVVRQAIDNPNCPIELKVEYILSN